MSRRVGASFAFLLLLLAAILHSFPQQHLQMSNHESSPVSDTVRFVIVSDTHRQYQAAIPPGDVFVHCGDSELTSAELDEWASKLPHTYKLAICGNMDRRLDRGKDHLRHITYLQDTHVTIKGIKVYGSPWTPEFVGVFQLGSENDAKVVWDKVPDDTDVLITHGPPKGVLDRTSRGMRVGDRELLRRVQTLKPRLHCFGHVHESYGSLNTNGTLFCNAAVFHGQEAFVVDVPTQKGLPAVVQAPEL